MYVYYAAALFSSVRLLYKVSLAWSVLPTRCLLSMVCTIYSVSTFGVYFACFYFPSRSRCLLSAVHTTYSGFTFCDPYYLLGVYFRYLLGVLLLSLEIDVCTFCGPYYLLGVYFQCLLSVSTL